MAGFDGSMPIPINPNSAQGIRDILDVPSNQEMEAAIAQSTALVNASASNITVASGAFRLDLAVTVPSGYTIAGVVAWNFGARVNVSITGIEAYGGYVRIFGTNNGTSTTVNPTAKVLCVKQ